MPRRALTSLVALGLSGCLAGGSEPGFHDGKFDDLPAGARAALEIHAMDLWAQYLPDEATLVVRRDGAELGAVGFPVAIIPLVEPGRYRITLSAPDHEPIEAEVDYDGSAASNGVRLVSFEPAGRAGLSLARGIAARPGRDVAVHSLFFGLRHRWFSASGRPARRGNDLTLLMDGEETYARVRQDLDAARDSIHVATWWWESDFELTRPPGHESMTSAQRDRNTILRVLEASPARKRVMVGQLVGQDWLLSWLTTDAPLRAHGAAQSRFEFMGQANETSGRFFFAVEPFRFRERVLGELPGAASLDFESEHAIRSTIPPRVVDLTEMPLGLNVNHASYHQKFMVIDGEVAYVSGKNLRRTDWDTSAYRVYEPRRMLFSSSNRRRQQVADRKRLPDLPPRKDYSVRVRGPSVRDVAEVFKARWDLLRAERATYSENSTRFEVDRAIAPVPGGVQAQVTTTLPDPLWEHSIAESWLNAIGNAERFILIEDQYFRAPMLTSAIMARMREVPDLRLIVISVAINEWIDPGCWQTYIADQTLGAAFPDRYLLLQLRSFDHVATWGWNETEARFVDIDVHSKLLIVDDVFLSVGSANKNNRGMVYEGEMNLAVLDREWVRAARRRVLARVLPPQAAPTDDPAVFWHQLVAAANWNGHVRANWAAVGDDIRLQGAPLPLMYTPRGLVYPLAYRDPKKCLIENIGEDMFAPPPPDPRDPASPPDALR